MPNGVACRQGEASSLRLLLQRWTLEQSLLVWDSGFHSSYVRKKPEHWHAPPLELDLDFHQIIALVT